MASISSWWNADSQESGGTWQLIGDSVQGVLWNGCVGVVSAWTATGGHMWVYGIFNNYFEPTPRSVSDMSLNALAGVTTILTGAWVGENIGYSSVPLAEAAGVGINPAYMGLMGATAAAVTSIWLQHCRDDSAGKRKK